MGRPPCPAPPPLPGGAGCAVPGLEEQGSTCLQPADRRPSCVPDPWLLPPAPCPPVTRGQGGTGPLPPWPESRLLASWPSLWMRWGVARGQGPVSCCDRVTQAQSHVLQVSSHNLSSLLSFTLSTISHSPFLTLISLLILSSTFSNVVLCPSSSSNVLTPQTSSHINPLFQIPGLIGHEEASHGVRIECQP